MFRSRTLIVVGAGASYEVGLPTGAQLKRTIGQKLAIKFDRNGRLLEHGDVIEALKLYALHKRSGDLQCVLSAAKSIQIAMSQAPSIDDYLDLHGDNSDIQAVGKIAITYAIIEAERSSTLYFEQTKETMPRFEILEDTWYAKFFHALRVPKQNLHKIFENVSIITFNYDRCIEHYLVCALENYYCITQQEAIEVASSLKIFHPFGVVGRLDWLSRDQNTVSFGGSNMRNALHLLALAEQIKTFYERTHEETMVEEMRAEVENAEVIVFLGFAFHRPNMDLVRPRKSRAMQRSIFGTVKGMSQSDCDMIRYQLTYMFVAPGEFQIQLCDMTCNDFFKNYYRGLTC